MSLLEHNSMVNRGTPVHANLTYDRGDSMNQWVKNLSITGAGKLFIQIVRYKIGM